MTATKKSIILTLATVLALGAAGVSASGMGHGAKHEAFAQTRISAAQAVDAAVSRVQGQPVEVDFSYKNGRSYYKVEIVSGSRQQEVFVDASNGSVIDTRPDYDDKRRVVPQTGVSLKQALAAAEAKVGGRAKDAELKHKGAQPVYQVEVVKGAEKYEVRVDAANGQVLSSHIDM